MNPLRRISNDKALPPLIATEHTRGSRLRRYISRLVSRLLHPSLFVIVFILLVVTVVVISAPAVLIVITHVSHRIESAAISYSEYVSEAAGNRLLPFFTYPQNILLYTAPAFASPVRSNVNAGQGWFNPEGSINNAAFWLAPYAKRYSGIYYTILDNSSLTCTLVCHQSLFFGNANVGPDNVVVMQLGAPNASGSCHGKMVIRPYSNPTKPTTAFQYEQLYDFRQRPHFVQTMTIPSDSPNSKIPKWFPPTLSFYADTMTMFVTLPYYGVGAKPVANSSTGAVMPSGVQSVMFVLSAVSSLMQNLSYSHTPLLQGSFALFEVSTRAFLGGNFGESGIRRVSQAMNVTLSNGTIVTTYQNATRMASICEASDRLLQEACAEIGEDIIASCATPCVLPFHASAPPSRFGSSLVKSQSLLHVTEVRNEHTHLNLRLVVVTDLNAVMDELQFSLLIAVTTIWGVGAALIIVASVAAYRSLAPLHKVEEKMLEASRTVRECDAGAEQPSATAIIEALSVIDSNTATESMFSEVDQVLLAFEVLAADLRGICAFLPREVSSQDNHSTSRDDAVGSLNGSQVPDYNAMTAATSVATSVDTQNLLQGSRLPALGIKNVTVAFLNFPRTHTVIDMRKAAARLDQIAAVVLDCAGKSRGVVESFFGDQFMVSFNASRKSSTHPLQAAYFLECLHDELSSVDDDTLAGHATNAPYVPMVYAGVCTGPALVRQLEAPSLLLRTQIVGHVISQASSLMRLAKSRETSVLLSDTMIAALHGVQFHSPAVEQDALRSVRTMIPRVYVHHTALVRVAFRSAPMLTASLFRAPPTGDKPSSISMTIKQAAHVGLHARIREAIPTMIDPQTRCDPLLCKSVRCSPPVVTIQGIAAANNAMSVYQSGNTAEARFLAQKCNEEHPPLLTRFFFMTGVLKSV